MQTDGNEAVRQQEKAQNHAYDADSDPIPAGADGKLDVTPAPGGYAGRDPKTEMPVVPSVPATHDDPHEHDAGPDGKERAPHE